MHNIYKLVKHSKDIRSEINKHKEILSEYSSMIMEKASKEDLDRNPDFVFDGIWIPFYKCPDITQEDLKCFIYPEIGVKSQYEGEGYPNSNWVILSFYRPVEITPRGAEIAYELRKIESHIEFYEKRIEQDVNQLLKLNKSIVDYQKELSDLDTDDEYLKKIIDNIIEKYDEAFRVMED